MPATLRLSVSAIRQHIVKFKHLSDGHTVEFIALYRHLPTQPVFVRLTLISAVQLAHKIAAGILAACPAAPTAAPAEKLITADRLFLVLCISFIIHNQENSLAKIGENYSRKLKKDCVTASRGCSLKR